VVAVHHDVLHRHARRLLFTRFHRFQHHLSQRQVQTDVLSRALATAQFLHPILAPHCRLLDFAHLSLKLNKDQLSLTNLRDALHRGERAANKQGGRSL